MHPFAKAFEKGVLVGALVAQQALTGREYRNFVNGLGSELDNMQDTAKFSSYDLEHRMMLAGRTTIETIQADLPPALLVLKPGSIDLRANDLYSDSIGYAVELAQRNLIQTAMRTGPYNDINATADITNDLNRLSNMDPGAIVTYFARSQE